MLIALRLQNYRGFEAHTVPLRSFTTIVGQNNAGKSTIVEALRLVSIVVSRHRNLGYRRVPEWLDRPLREVGVSPSMKDAGLDFKSVFNQYGDPPAIVEAEFEDGSSVVVYLGPGEAIHAVILAPGGRPIRSRHQATELDLPPVSIMPQVGPVASPEKILSEDYVKRTISSPLAPRHFRNQLKVLQSNFAEFQRVAEENWSGLQVLSLEGCRGLPGEILDLEIRNREFVGEVAAMGHGLQMWLQMVWFLVRAKGAATVILDEPDVYMHPDLQRRLVGFLRGRYPQVILTTHSVEIMSEVDPEEVLIVDRRQPESRFAETLPAVQRLLESVGSAHNLHLSRLWDARRVILVEGDDLKFLRAFQRTLFPDSVQSLEAVPNLSIGGWGGWRLAVGSSMAFDNAMGDEVTTYCILDSDFHTEGEIKKRQREASEHGVQLHIWSRKELENFVLCASAIARLIRRRTNNPSVPAAKVVEEKLISISDDLEVEIIEGMASEIQAEDRKLAAGTASKRARTLLKEKREKAGSLMAFAPGRDVLAKLSAWSQESFGVSISAISIARSMRINEIPEELGKVVTALEHRWSFVGDTAEPQD